MKKVMEEIDAAFKLISVISVSGEGVDVMSGVREHLRNAYNLAKECDRPRKTGEDKNG